MAGLQIVKGKLAREIKGIKERSLEGIDLAARQEGLRTIPITPIKTGDLRGSLIVTNNGNPEAPQAAIAFKAPYAPRVHETFLRYKVGGAKFLERTLDQDHDLILRTIQTKARILT